MAHTLTRIVLHCVFGTKDRRPFLVERVSEKLNPYLASIARNHDMHLLRAGGMPDHRHLLLQLRPATSAAEAMRVMKAYSSRWLRETYAELSTFAWQRGYAAFAVSRSAEPKARRYIDAQAEHHQKMTFEEELVALLKRHGVDYDPRFLLD
jgi:REP element-mobilizing transposase RayT